jgi:hypothetical protein
MAAEESDGDDASPILDSRYQPVVVALDVENNPAGFENSLSGTTP